MPTSLKSRAKLGNVCPNCNASNPPQYRFCGKCGHNLALPQPKGRKPAERHVIRYFLITIGCVLIAAIIGVALTNVGSHRPALHPSLVAPPTSPAASVQQPPSAPLAVSAQALSEKEVSLRWVDNSNNEDGFNIYRDGSLIVTVNANVTTYQETDLQAATCYQYLVRAFNEAGQSEAASCAVTTLNPSIIVTLDKVGVYFDHDPSFFKGAGEIYIGIVITDGIKTQKLKIPRGEGSHYSLNDNEIEDVGAVIFSTESVGDYLKICAVAYESDGGDFESLIYQTLGMVATEAVTGGSGVSLLGMFDMNLGNLIGSLLGAEDDFVGSYEHMWDGGASWGVGQYNDVQCEDLRLWFTIREH